jgi:hypothetical protein
MNDESPEMQERWRAWQQKNRNKDRALRANLRIVIPVAIMLVAVACWLYVSR